MSLADSEKQKHLNTVNSRLSRIMGRRKIMDNPKPWFKQQQSEHGTKWI
jgi:hypothetical protein